MPTPQPLTGFAKAAIVLESFLSVGALGGGAALMLGPKGEVIKLPTTHLNGSPFPDHFVPGLVLFLALGVFPLWAVLATWRHGRGAPLMAVGVGITLAIWMTVEILVIGYSSRPPLQPFYSAFGVMMIAFGWSWHRAEARTNRAP